MLDFAVSAETWRIAGAFRIARGSKTAADVVTAAITEDGLVGCGECVPYARYGETIDSVIQSLSASDGDISSLKGAARNALDCALWDLKAKRTGQPAWALAGLPEPKPRHTAFTLSIDRPDMMAATALAHADKPILKMKLAGDGDDIARVRAVRAARNDAQIIVDANESFDLDSLRIFLGVAADENVALIEQPLPSDQDGALEGLDSPAPLCADESLHTSADLKSVARRYEAINIKLDKTGGLTEAIATARRAQDLGLTIMVGCMVGTSLSMAPAFMLESFAAFIDLDGPLLLERDRRPGITFDGALMHPPPKALWG